MGLAWVDDGPPRSGERALRCGGLPLLPESVPWPECPSCSLPLLFRAQVPLALTSLVAFDDPRLLSVFECHAHGDGGPCDGASVLVVGEPLVVRSPPHAASSDVILVDTGPRAHEVARIVDAVDGYRGFGRMVLPTVILRSAPFSIARETVRAVEEAGGRALLGDGAPTVLGNVRGGRVVPFDDGPRALYRTTLPPLDRISSDMERGSVRGVFGGIRPGFRDHSFGCGCGRQTRTAVRLTAQRDPDPHTAVTLEAAAVEVCLHCSIASLHRPYCARPMHARAG